MTESRFHTGYDLDKHGVTHSLLSTWATCPQKAELELHGWQHASKSSPALYYGSVMHDLLQAYYSQSLSFDGTEPTPAVVVERYQGDNQTDEQQKLLEHAVWVFDEYCEYWSLQNSSMQTRECEHQFDVPYWGFRLRGKRDRVVRDDAGHYWIVEVKTGAQFNSSEWVDRISFDSQFLLYDFAFKLQHGKYPTGILFDWIRRPGVKNVYDDIKKRPDFYYNRMTVSIDPDIRKRFKKELRRKLVNFRHFTKDENKCYRNEGACFGRGACAYVEACSTQSLAAYRKTRPIHPELENAEDQKLEQGAHTQSRGAEEESGVDPAQGA